MPTRERYPYLVATDARGTFLAYAKAGVWRERTAYRWTAEVGIYAIAGIRGKGVGGALYRSLIEACRERGFHMLVAGITMPNETSVRLHERIGFRHVGTFARVGWKFGRWHDVSFYELPLADPSVAADPRLR